MYLICYMLLLDLVDMFLMRACEASVQFQVAIDIPF